MTWSEVRSCVKVEVDVLGSLSLMVPTFSLGVKATFEKDDDKSELRTKNFKFGCFSRRRWTRSLELCMDLSLLRVLIFPPRLMAVTLFQFTGVWESSGQYRWNWRTIARSCRPTWDSYHRYWRSRWPNCVSQHLKRKKIVLIFCPTCGLHEGTFHVFSMNCV